MKHFAEDELIAYQMHEACDRPAMREHLEHCEACAEMAASIAETLRVYSADAGAEPDMEAAWMRLRGRLPVLSAPSPRRIGLGWMWPATAFALASLLAIWISGWPTGKAVRHGASSSVARSAGPLTDHPLDPAMSAHLDDAERLLTEVSHGTEPLDEATRARAHDLQLKNALYLREARDGGDLADAAVLENVGRTLTALDHEARSRDRGWHVRFEMNTDGLLLDIRILRQNEVRISGESR